MCFRLVWVNPGRDAEARHWAYAGTLSLDELAKRETRVLADLADHPPAHLVAAIGRPDPDPLDGPYPARWSWMSVASHVMSYRRQYAITDPTRALGANPTRPAGLAQETDWRLVTDEIRWSAGNLGEHLIDPRVLAVFDPTAKLDTPQALAALSDPTLSRTAIPEARQHRIRAAPTQTLRAEVTKALGMIRARPPDRSAELQRLTAAHGNLTTLYRQDRAAAAGPGQRLGDPAASHDQLRRRLGELDAAITTVRREQRQREAWDTQNGGTFAAARLAAEELATREHEALLALEQDPPPHLVTELGQPPANKAGRQAWRHGARLIEQYRTRHDIDDPDRRSKAPPRIQHSKPNSARSGMP